MKKNAEDASCKTPEMMLVQYNLGASAFDTRVRFWGKVVDQHGNPVEGAMIKAIATTLRMVKVENGYREYEILSAQSADDGTFMFDGAEGFSLTIRQLSKDGYVLPSAYQAGTRWEGARYRYRYKSIGNQQKTYKPDSTHPEIFHLWKLHKPEPVDVRGDGVGRDGIELFVGRPATKLRTTTIRVSDVGTSGSPEWEVTVTAREAYGGVVKAEVSDVFMFEAPKFGYTHSITFRYGREGSDEGGDDTGAPVRFFVRSIDGREYSACDYGFFSPNQDGRVLTRMRSWTNPNGSRNLEHDAAHLLEKPCLKR